MISYDTVLRHLYTPTHPTSLAISRIFFGFLMMLDIPDERGGSIIDLRWGEMRNCYFPLFPHMARLSLPWMCVLYGLMWVGALGICLGYKFRTSCLIFSTTYWYILLLEKSFWNNHSYLYGLLSILFLVSSASNCWSIDSLLNGKQRSVPYWNYFIFKFQFFILYFFAGLKKTDMEWLEGYSMAERGKHWVFTPFTLLLTTEQVDYFIIHCSGFLLDLTVGFFLLHKVTRPVAMIFCAMFHLMNTRLFSIGMFPYVCLALMPVYCDPDWPENLMKRLHINVKNIKYESNTNFQSRKKHVALTFIIMHCFIQIFLPYSHFITKGYNNWTNGLYGYSWDMMVHSWDTTLVVVKVVDNNSGKEHFLDPYAWTNNDRWSKHADMCVQYASCLKDNLMIDFKNNKNEHSSISNYITSDNISIYFDVWCSLNGRFQQRMYNPNYDMLNARWSPFKNVEWLLPLLTEYNDFRKKIKVIQEHVHSWSNYSDVLFVADFPGLYLENYISPELTNVTISVIEGEVYYENDLENIGYKLSKGESMSIMADVFHKIHTISDVPSCFMYTYTNSTKEALKEENTNKGSMVSPFPLLEDGADRIDSISKMFYLISNSLLHIFYGVPMSRRTKLME